MGDRANIHVLPDDLAEKNQNDPGVYLYTHWGGSELPITLRETLKRELRWDDGPYLTRMIFCAMVKGNEKDDTGFGISTGICDNEHLILHVNPARKTVTIGEGTPIPFEEFIKLTDDDLLGKYEE